MIDSTRILTGGLRELYDSLSCADLVENVKPVNSGFFLPVGKISHLFQNWCYKMKSLLT